MTARKIHAINFKRNLKIYFSFLKDYKLMASIIILLVFIVEASYAVDKFLFKLIIDNATEFVAGNSSRDSFILYLIIIAAIFLSVALLRSILKFIDIHILNRLSMNIITSMKRRFYNHIIHLSHAFHTTHKTGSLISRLIRGSNAAERMTDVFIFNAAPLLFQMIIVTSALIYFNAISALVLVLTVVSFIGFSIMIQNKQRVYNLRRTIREDSEKAYISDTMINISSIKYFGKERAIKNRFKNLSKKTYNAFIRFWDYYRWLDFGRTLILGIGVFFLVYFPIIGLLAGEQTIGNIVFIYTIYGNLMGPLFGFVHGIRNYYRAMADFEELFKYSEIENEIKDKSNAKKMNVRKGTIEFKNISFRYHKHWLFKNFALKINKNQKVALVGHSGCGKTTLVKLLYRFYDVDEGQILIDGKDIKDFKQESLREELSIVPQETVLFDDTIYNNIAFSNPKADRKDVFAAMKFAQLDEIVNEFPHKEKTIVGERGVKLSGGEKQRVSIARAILADKKILVLDEATSSLDSETEHEIQRDLKKLMKGRTNIIIAHRLSTIMHADKIVVMEKGKIVQIGKHKKLIKQKGPYKRLWSLQKGGYIK